MRNMEREKRLAFTLKLSDKSFASRDFIESYCRIMAKSLWSIQEKDFIFCQKIIHLLEFKEKNGGADFSSIKKRFVHRRIFSFLFLFQENKKII